MGLPAPATAAEPAGGQMRQPPADCWPSLVWDALLRAYLHAGGTALAQRHRAASAPQCAAELKTSTSLRLPDLASPVEVHRLGGPCTLTAPLTSTLCFRSSRNTSQTAAIRVLQGARGGWVRVGASSGAGACVRPPPLHLSTAGGTRCALLRTASSLLPARDQKVFVASPKRVWEEHASGCTSGSVGGSGSPVGVFTSTIVPFFR